MAAYESFFSRNRKLLLLLAIIIVVGGGVLLVPRRVHPDGAKVTLAIPAKARVGETIDLPLNLTVSKPINAGEFYIHYDPAIVEIMSFAKTDSIFSLWVLDTPKLTRPGEIWIAGGLPNPGFTGTGHVATIRAQLLKEGSPDFQILDSSRVLLDDGKGTKLPLTAAVGELTIGK